MTSTRAFDWTLPPRARRMESMQFNLRIRDIVTSDELTRHVERRARFALSRFASRVTALHVTLSDVNGPRGGVDKLCRATAGLDGLASITVTSCDENIRAAVDRAFERLSRSVQRAFERRLERRSAAWSPTSAVADP